MKSHSDVEKWRGCLSFCDGGPEIQTTSGTPQNTSKMLLVPLPSSQT